MVTASEALVARGERTTVRALSIVYTHVLLEISLREEAFAAPHCCSRVICTRRPGGGAGARVDPHRTVERVPVMDTFVRPQAV